MVLKNDSHKMMDILLDHVLFPRVLPQEKSKPIHELELLMKMIENVENLSKWLPLKTVEMLQRLKRIHIECTPAVIWEEINDLKPGKIPILPINSIFIVFKFCNFTMNLLFIFYK